jgi:hypothetical protein
MDTSSTSADLPSSLPLLSNSFWSYSIGDKVFLLLTRNQEFEQPEGGYKIFRQLKIRNRPAYQVTGAFFPHRTTNIFYEDELISVTIVDELTTSWDPFLLPGPRRSLRVHLNKQHESTENKENISPHFTNPDSSYNCIKVQTKHATKKGLRL